MRLLMRLIQNLIFIDLIFVFSLYIYFFILENFYMCIYFNSIISNIIEYVNIYDKNILINT